MSSSERRFLSADESLFRVEYDADPTPVEDDEPAPARWVGRTDAVVEVGGQVATKTHASQAAYARERDALAWLQRGLVAGVPRLLAANDSARRLTMERVAGAGIGGSHHARSARSWEAAGRWLRALHARPGAPDEASTLRAEAHQRLSHALEGAGGSLPAEVREVAAKALHELAESTAWEVSPVFTHGDFQPSNWMLTTDGRFYVVDYERAAWAAPERDLARLVPIWRTHPELARPFFAEAGASPSSWSDERLRVFTLIDALETLAWAHEHRRDDYQVSGRALAQAAADDYLNRSKFVPSS